MAEKKKKTTKKVATKSKKTTAKPTTASKKASINKKNSTSTNKAKKSTTTTIKKTATKVRTTSAATKKTSKPKKNTSARKTAAKKKQNISEKVAYFDILPIPGLNLFVAVDEKGLIFTSFSSHPQEDFEKYVGKNYRMFRQAVRLRPYLAQFKEYFTHQRQTFDMPIHYVKGSAFEQNVWKKLNKIPFSKTASYLELAKMMHKSKAVRAVATAVGKNPVLIANACHRVINNNGSLGKYRDGEIIKALLLKHEGAEFTLPPELQRQVNEH